MDELIKSLGSEPPGRRATLLGYFILRQFAEKKITPAAAAEALGVSPATFGAYASGQRPPPPGHRLSRLEALLSLPAGSFESCRSALGSNVLGVALGSAVLGAASLGTRSGPKDFGSALGSEDILAGHISDPPTLSAGDENADEEAHASPEERPDIIAGEVQGYAAVWDELDSKNATLFRPRAFTETIAESQAVLIYWEHAHSMPDKGGSTPIGASFSLQEDAIGLWMRAWIADTTLGRDIVTLMGVIEGAGLEMGASVAGFPVIWRPNFVEPPRAWERGVDAGPGALLSFGLKEISLAGFPALDSARVRLATDDPAAMIAASNDRLARIIGG